MKTLTIAEAARRNTEPKWYSKDGYSAHLMTDDKQSLCGYTWGGLSEAPAWHARCGNCKNRLRKVLEAALQPSPRFVTETVTLTVTRPVKDNMDAITLILDRKLRSNTSWDTKIALISQVAVEPEDVDGDEETVNGHHVTCSFNNGGTDCDCGAEEA